MDESEQKTDYQPNMVNYVYVRVGPDTIRTYVLGTW